MKMLGTNGLSELIRLIKSSFIHNTDVEELTSLDIDETPTSNSPNLVTSGGVREELDGKLSNQDFTFLTLPEDTLHIYFAANQRCYQFVDISSSIPFQFTIFNKADNHLLVHNIGSNDVRIDIHDVEYGVGHEIVYVDRIMPDEIVVPAGKYVKISVVTDGTKAVFTASQDLDLLHY